MLTVRPFAPGDAQTVAALVGRNFLEVNSKDYPLQEMQALAAVYNAEKILEIASYAHMYVVTEGDALLGVGAISSYWGSLTESILLTIFVLPQAHGRGIGRLIIQALEADPLFLRARRIEIPASITAAPFYEKMGYAYKGGIKELDEEGHYRMEKFRP